MMKTFGNLSLAAILFLFFSCGNPEADFKKAEFENTIESYQLFLKQYPDSEISKSAYQKLINLEFDSTCKVNTKIAFDVFVEKYKDIKYSNLDTLTFEKISRETRASGIKMVFENFFNNQSGDPREMESMKKNAPYIAYEILKETCGKYGFTVAGYVLMKRKLDLQGYNFQFEPYDYGENIRKKIGMAEK